MKQQPDSFSGQVRTILAEQPDLTNEQVYLLLIKSNPRLNPDWIRNTANKYISRRIKAKP